MGIKTWEWEKSLHTVTSKHLQKVLIALKFICDFFLCFIHNYRDLMAELSNGNGNGRELGIDRWENGNGI